MRPLGLLLILIGACAQSWGVEGVARVEAGSLLRADERLPLAAIIPAGVELTCAATGPAALRLQECARSRLLIAAGSRLTVQREDGSLVVDIGAGAVQLELHDRGPYRRVLLRGRAAEAVVTGTLLVGEVLPNDRDLFAVAEGAVVVRLRREVAKALGQEDEEVELRQRQHVLASRSEGIGAVRQSGGRYQLDGGAAERRDLLVQLRRATREALASGTATAAWEASDRAAQELDLEELAPGDGAVAAASGSPDAVLSEQSASRSVGGDAASSEADAAAGSEPAAGEAGAGERDRPSLVARAEGAEKVERRKRDLRRAVVEDAVDALLDSDRLIDELVQINLLHGPLDDFPAPP